jgi:hypothetical protein
MEVDLGKRIIEQALDIISGMTTPADNEIKRLKTVLETSKYLFEDMAVMQDPMEVRKLALLGHDLIAHALTHSGGRY